MIKLIVTFLFLAVFSFSSIAQAPDGINYQAVIRNNSGALIVNTNIAIRIQIRQNSPLGTIVYQERHAVTSSPQGLVNTVIGTGIPMIGTFNSINWGNGPFYICLGVDFTNGTNFQDYGAQQMMSVPYALYAKSAGTTLNQWRYGNTAPSISLGTFGDFYLDVSNGNVYYKSNGSTWTLTGNITGPQGNTGVAGSQGPIGLTGATGPQGPIGLTGPQGPIGLTGATGTSGPQGLTGPTGPQGPIGLTGSTGPQGLTGPTGPQGPIGLTGSQGPIGLTGATGATGPQGSAGINGTAVLNGTTAPSSAIGSNGDFFINTTTNTLYGPKANGSWPAGTSLVGPQGLTGATGPAGTQGLTGPTGSQGPVGLTGATGATGPQGSAGINGTAILNGTTAPSSAIGSNGDFFMNTTTNTLYGPKANGSWPAGTSLFGPQGATGPQGPIGLTGATGATGPQGLTGSTGPQGPIGLTGATGSTGPQGLAGINGTAVLNGTSAPSSAIGSNGDFFMNTTTNTLYGPKANGGWPAGTSLIGPQGLTGATGPAGPQGLTGPTGPQGPIGLTGATGPLVSGTIGQTLTNNGTTWVASSTLTNTNNQIGIGSSSIPNSAVLQVQSTTQGVLLPSMTSTQRLAISSPAMGLLVFQNNSPVGFFYYDGSTWQQLGVASSTSTTTGNEKTLIYTTDGF